ncbi:MAG TPA: hypothetical protein VHL31_14770 [Geminicoccus sp.]|uniref:hypothetical protein n=1 Tax=Geminicoccus sp. TaxID=2024832 RepID=UPI002E342F79|nr:hypothetical protein [Geminicoccus sp.]HEX2527544.1 hypothetical protein [Geminicoccus sp.]
MILTETRLIGCPVYASTHANIRWHAGHYFSFQAPKSGVVTGFLWQTQGARQHAEPGDQHSGGNFGCYRVRFHRCNDWTQPKGPMLASGVVTPGELGYYPGRQVGGFDILDPSSPIAGVPRSPELVGGLHVQAWLNRTQALNGKSVYCGTAYVYIDVTADGAPWTVTAGEWILAEVVNLAAQPTVNFSFDNNAFSASAAHPGQAVSNSPIDRLLAVREHVLATEQPSTNSSAGGARGMIPFYLLRYDDDRWYGQPWYYRGRFPGGSTGGRLFDEHATDPTAPALATADRGPALLLYGERRLRQVLTPPADFQREKINALYLHGWRWTSLTGYGEDKRLGVRILRVSTVGGRNLTLGFRQIWPPPHAYGDDLFRVGSAGPFKAFPAGTFAAFGQDVVQGKTLSITPTNLTSRTSPTLGEFERVVPCIPYGRLTINPSIEISASYRYVIEIMAEPGSAYAMQMQKNPHRYLNLRRKKSDNTIDTSQGRAFMPDGTQRPPITIPQVWPCNPMSVPTVAEDNTNNSGRYYNTSGKLYAPSGSWREFNDHMIPVCLMPEL